MYNIFASQYRRKVKFESQYDPEPVIDRQTRPALQDMKYHGKEVYEAICNMSPDHKKVLVEITLKGKSYKNVAKKLGVPLGTVRSRLNRARSILHEELDDPANENDNPAHFTTDEYKTRIN